MRWRLLGLIQVLALIAHLYALPVGIASRGSLPATRDIALEPVSVLKDAPPLAFEKRSHSRAISLAFQAQKPAVDLPSPPARGQIFRSPAQTLAFLTGFQLRVSERPPPAGL